MHLAFGMAAAGVYAQPPTAPDPRPEMISPEALNEAIGGPSIVSLSFEKAPPEEIVRALVQQVGVALDSYASTDLLKTMPPVNVSLKDQPFIVALANFAAQLGLSFTLKNPTGFDKPPAGMTLQLQKTADPHQQLTGPISTHGPFVVIATAIERKRAVALASARAAEQAPITREEATLDFVVFADPKLRERGMFGTPHFTDGGGWRIRAAENEAPWDARARQQGPPFLEWRYRATCELPSGAQQAPPLKATGSGVVIATKSEQWEIEDPTGAKNLVKETQLGSGSRRYEINAITSAPARPGQHSYDVVLTISGVGVDKGRWSGWPSLPASVVVDSFRLLDAEGRDYAPITWDIKGGTFTARFDNTKARRASKPASGPATNARWTIPTELRTAEIPVELPSQTLP